MGPSCKRKIRNSRKTTTCKSKKKCEEEITVAAEAAAASPTTTTVPVSPLKKIDGGIVVDSSCTTPKAKKFRIPEIKTCPPAPKKRRILSKSNCSLRRSPISFFAPPDLELFFFVALRPDVSV